MHTDPLKLRSDAEEAVHAAAKHQTDTMANRTGTMEVNESDHLKSEAAKAKQALNNETARTRIIGTNSDNQFRT